MAISEQDFIASLDAGGTPAPVGARATNEAEFLSGLDASAPVSADEGVIGLDAPIVPGSEDDFINGLDDGTTATTDDAKNVASYWDRWVAGFRRTRTDMDNWAAALEAAVPTARIEIGAGGVRIVSQEERFGDDFRELTFDQRRDRIREVEYAKAVSKNPNVAPGDEALFGQIVGTLATPTTAAPVARGVGGAVVAGGLLGAETGAAAAAAGEPGANITESAVISALAGGAFAKAAQLVQGARTTRALKASAARAAREAPTAANATAAAATPEQLAIQFPDNTPGVQTDMFEHLRPPNARGVALADAGATIPTAQAVEANAASDAIERAPATKLVRAIQWEIAEVHAPTFLKIKKLEHYEASTTAALEAGLKPFERAFKRLPAAARAATSRAMLSGDFATARAAVGDSALAAWRSVFEKTYDMAASVTKDMAPKLTDYAPRILKDRNGFLKALGKADGVSVAAALSTATAKAGRPLTDVEASNVVLGMLRPRPNTKARLSASFARNWREIPAEFQQYFYTAPEAAVIHIRHVTHNKAVKDFFKGAVKDTEAGSMNVDASVADLLRRSPEFVNSPVRSDNMRMLLTSYFGAGEQAPGRVVQAARNIGWLGTIANMNGVLTQFGDAFTSAAAWGPINTLRASLSKAQLNAVELGVARVSHEMSENPTTLGRVLETVMKRIGFNKVDTAFKTLAVKASLRKAQALASTDAGRKLLTDRYGAAFGDDFPALIEALKDGDGNNTLVQLYQFAEVSRYLPVSKSAMPRAYLDHPNGRILYLLKTYTIGTLNGMARDVRERLRVKDYVGAGRRIAEYSTILTLGGYSVAQVKQALWGTSNDKNTTQEMADSLLRTYGASSYTADNFAKGNVGTALLNLAAPPLSLLDNVGRDIAAAIKGEPVDLAWLPGVGRIYKNMRDNEGGVLNE